MERMTRIARMGYDGFYPDHRAVVRLCIFLPRMTRIFWDYTDAEDQSTQASMVMLFANALPIRAIQKNPCHPW
jgi:hypothetical protein